MLPGLGLLLLVVFICEWLRYAGAQPAPRRLPYVRSFNACWRCAAGVAAAELIQDLETTVGAFFLTYFSAGLFALWLPVVFCRARYTRSCGTESRQRYELLPQGEDAANAGDAKGIRDNEVDAEDQGLVPTGFGSATSLAAECFHMLKLGLLFGPLWFFANWTYNASLELTSVRPAFRRFSPFAALYSNVLAEAAAPTTIHAGSIGHHPFGHVLFLVSRGGVSHGQRAASSAEAENGYQVRGSCTESSWRGRGCAS